jgi:peptidoglycan/xylan/chitin deacetylase (PgdA/CDA1 family)
MWYQHRTSFILQSVYPSLTWHKSREDKKIYLTFDDGPIPEMTPLVLEILAGYNIKATFFCVGDNIDKHPAIFQQVVRAGHKIGNHTHHHLDGWKTSTDEYVGNVTSCREAIANNIAYEPIFRPPYGKATRQQIKQLRATHEIIMWDVLSGDFDQSITPETCLLKTVKATQNGSIVIFHDNVKAKNNLIYALPKYIAHCLDNGYEFGLL